MHAGATQEDSPQFNTVGQGQARVGGQVQGAANTHTSRQESSILTLSGPQPRVRSPSGSTYVHMTDSKPSTLDQQVLIDNR